jgi:integrase
MCKRMGKDLRGKELGVGISQRKDGMYTGRFTTKSGKRKQKYFHKLQECRAWMADAQFEDEHGDVFFSDSPTVNAWFEYWLEEVKGNGIRISTKNNYENQWKNSAYSAIGDMELKDVKPIHCQKILNDLAANHKSSTIKTYRALMWSVFECAVENDFIQKNPVERTKVAGGERTAGKQALTLEEQKLFLQESSRYVYYNGLSFVLQTGLRVGELAALKWSDIDFENRKMRVERSAAWIDGRGFVFGNTKTESGKREIPLTKEAIEILKRQKEKNSQNKIVPIQYTDYIFVNSKGLPIPKYAYNKGIYAACDRAGIRRFSIHLLRHTFATRCIENGMRPKTLQAILGHSKIEMTMNLYVHVTEDSKMEEMEMIEENLKLV